MKKTFLIYGIGSLCLVFSNCNKKTDPDLASIDRSLIKGTNSVSAVYTPSIPSATINATAYGASTSSSNNSSAIQNAINAANTMGGGTVIVPSGTYLCGPLKMKNNVGLQLLNGTVLKSLAYQAYPGSGGTSDVDPLIDFSGVTNSKISGSGKIEGQGSAWWSAYLSSKANGAAIARPAMIGMEGGADVIEISGITIQNAPNNHIGIGKNNNSITVSGITINTPDNTPNTDGIGIWSPNVNILNCSISCGDDNIAMNTNAKYVTISGCTFGSGHGCSIGSYAANIDHITVDNCTFNGTDNGIRMKTNRTRSGTVQYLTFSNLTMNNVSNPFFICEYYPDNTIPSNPASDPSQAVTTTTPVWKYITFKNITATGCDKAGILWAVPEKRMRDIIFDNVKITANIGIIVNNVQNLSFINGSKISASNGNAFISTYNSSPITGINLTSGNPL